MDCAESSEVIGAALRINQNVQKASQDTVLCREAFILVTLIGTRAMAGLEAQRLPSELWEPAPGAFTPLGQGLGELSAHVLVLI